MSQETENHTIKLLQDMRIEIREQFAENREQFAEIREQFDAVNMRIDGMTHIMTLMAGHSHDLDQRLETVETRLKPISDGH